MKAVAVVPGRPQSLHVRDDVPMPRPGEGDALVKILEVGMCGTDLEINEGLYGSAPPGSPYLILGHENLGVVDAAPRDSGFAGGDLVVSTVRRPCPEACAPCRADQNDMCLTGHYLERGIGGLHGFMSEHYVEDTRYLVKIPAALRSVAVLMEPLSIVEKGIEQAFAIQARLPWQPKIAFVAGAGPVGILAAAVLRRRGLAVYVAARQPRGNVKDQLLAEIGATYVSTQETPIDKLRAQIGAVDLVFEATGAPPVVFESLSLLGPAGIGVLASVTGGSRKLEIDVAAWNQRLVLGNQLVFGTVNAGHRHFEAGVNDLMGLEAQHPGWARRLLTRRLPFTDATAALEKRSEDIKTVLDFS